MAGAMRRAATAAAVAAGSRVGSRAAGASRGGLIPDACPSCNALQQQLQQHSKLSGVWETEASALGARSGPELAASPCFGAPSVADSLSNRLHSLSSPFAQWSGPVSSPTYSLLARSSTERRRYLRQHHRHLSAAAAGGRGSKGKGPSPTPPPPPPPPSAAKTTQPPPSPPSTPPAGKFTQPPPVQTSAAAPTPPSSTTASTAAASVPASPTSPPIVESSSGNLNIYVTLAAAAALVLGVTTLYQPQVEKVTEKVEEAADEALKEAKVVAEKIEEEAKDFGHQLSDSLSHAAANVKEEVVEVTSKITHFGHEGSELIQEGLAAAKEAVLDATHKLMEPMAEESSPPAETSKPASEKAASSPCSTSPASEVAAPGSGIAEAAAAVAAAAATSAEDATRIIREIRHQADEYAQQAHEAAAKAAAAAAAAESYKPKPAALLRSEAESKAPAQPPAAESSSLADGSTSWFAGHIHDGDDSPALHGKIIVEAIREAERRQAAADAEILDEALSKLQEAHAAELTAAKTEVASRAKQIEALERSLQSQAEASRRAIETLRHQANQLLEAELMSVREKAEDEKAAAVKATEQAASRALIKERAHRVAALDDLRLQVNALSEAFSSRSKETHRSHRAHVLATSTEAISSAAERGDGFDREAILLARSLVPEGDGDDFIAAGDPLVEAVLNAIPSEVARKGAPTRAQLSARFNTVGAAARQVALVPAAGGGVLTFAVARLAAVFKIPEKGAPDAASPLDSGPETVLALAKRHLDKGELAAAADILDEGFKGTAAAAAVADWIQLARTREALDQSVSLLKAYATTVASSMS